MHEHVAGLLLGVGDAKAHAVDAHRPGVSDLAARLAIERGLVEHHRAGFAGFQRLDLVAVMDEREHHAFRAFGVVAEEFGRPDLVA